MGELHIINHPLIQHKLTIMRDENTGSKDFRELLREIAMLMGYELTRDFALEDVQIKTPICEMTGKRISGKKMAIVPILRAGLGMVDGLIDLVPAAKVGHIGLYRDPKTKKPVEYFIKLPKNIKHMEVFLIDPMFATGGSAIDAVNCLKKRGVKKISFICMVAAPEGVKAFCKVHKDVPVYIGALDRKLNNNKYILPGLGDAGDRIFGTED